MGVFFNEGIALSWNTDLLSTACIGCLGTVGSVLPEVILKVSMEVVSWKSEQLSICCFMTWIIRFPFSWYFWSFVSNYTGEQENTNFQLQVRKLRNQTSIHKPLLSWKVKLSEDLNVFHGGKRLTSAWLFVAWKHEMFQGHAVPAQFNVWRVSRAVKLGSIWLHLCISPRDSY